ncbi:Calnexin [Toxocara canis]|uniref:Calnexin n=1 Tax=Toxocara canis TaxID=6265 RepID=A0A0B2VNA3_TOXCA|nr:Calnexin [Toxocara canis]
MKWWHMSPVLSLLFAVCVLADDDASSKPAYVAPKFVAPTVVGSPLLVDWFDDVKALNKKWILSRGKKDDVEDSIAKYNGEWEIGPPKKKVIDGDLGLIVKTKARHHAVAAQFSKPFTFSGKPLVAQYEVKYEEGQECGGGYIKLLTVGAEKKLSEFTDKTPYTIMFGPDKCGQTAKVHFIVLMGEYCEWEIGPPKKKVIDGDLGLIVKTKARHHAVAAQFSKPFTFSGKPLVAQYEVKYEEGQECGGGYIKLLTVGAEKKLSEFTDKTPYTIMFGPDKCGQTAKVHFIVRFTNPKSGIVTEHHAKQPSKPVSSYFDDRHTHLYTLIVNPDDTFKVLVDNSEIMSGSLLTDLEPSITPPATTDDPDDKKPADWDEREMIDDPDAKKPDDWDEDAPKEIEDESAVKPSDWLEEEPVHIHDPSAKKPDDWDDELDQQWEAPLIPNPKCKDVSGCGPWKRPMIANPNYKPLTLMFSAYTVAGYLLALNAYVMGRQYRGGRAPASRAGRPGFDSRQLRTIPLTAQLAGGISNKLQQPNGWLLPGVRLPH